MPAALSQPAVQVPSRLTHRHTVKELKIKAQCGCGFNSSEVLDGVAHAEDTGHTLTITGIIRVQ